MFLVLVGALIGFGIAANPLGPISGAVAGVCDRFIAFGDAATIRMVELIASEGHGDLAVVLGALVGAATPGLVTLGLAVGARAASQAKVLVGATAALVSLAAFATLPTGQAAVVAVVAVGLGGVAGWAAASITTIVFAAVASALATTTVGSVLDGTDGRVAETARTLADVAGYGPESLWTVVTVAVAVAPVVAAAFVALRD